MTFPCHFLCCFSWASEHLLSVAASAQAPDLMCPGVGLGHPTTVGEWGRPHYSLNDAKLWDHLRFKRECQPGTKVWRDQSKKKRLGHKTPPAWQFPFSHRLLSQSRMYELQRKSHQEARIGRGRQKDSITERLSTQQNAPSQRKSSNSTIHRRGKSDVCWFKLHLIQLQLGSCKKKNKPT